MTGTLVETAERTSKVTHTLSITIGILVATAITATLNF